MLSKLSQTFLQNLIIHHADHRGYTKSNSLGTFEKRSQTWHGPSSGLSLMSWLLMSWCLLLLFLFFLCLTDGVDPAVSVSVIKCGPGLCMLKSLLGMCRLTVLSLWEYTVVWPHTSRVWFVFVVIFFLNKLCRTDGERGLPCKRKRTSMRFLCKSFINQFMH